MDYNSGRLAKNTITNGTYAIRRDKKKRKGEWSQTLPDSSHNPVVWEIQYVMHSHKSLVTIRRALHKFKGQMDQNSPQAKINCTGEIRSLKMLSVDEIGDTEIEISRIPQKDWFEEVTDAVKKRKPWRQEQLKKLGVTWVATNQLLRCKGRPHNWLEYNTKDAVILLPADHHMTQSFIEQTHVRLQHTGKNTVMVHLRRSLWKPRQKNDQERVKKLHKVSKVGFSYV